MTSPDDHNPEPPASRAGPSARNNSWILTAAAGLIGLYFLVSGALTMRDKHGNGVFALLMTLIVLAAAAIAWTALKSYRADRAAKK